LTRPLILLFLSSAFAAQTTSPAPRVDPPIDLPVNTHLTYLTPLQNIHADDEPEPPHLTPLQTLIFRSNHKIFNNIISVHLEIILNESGRVESAHAVDGPQRFYAQAEQIELHRAFAPVRIDNIATRVRAFDDVSIYPPEQWSATHIPFPSDPDLSTVNIGLSGLGYSVSIAGTGDVTFSSTNPSLAAPGTHHAHISPEAVRSLLDQFRKSDFLSAKDAYQCGWTDVESQNFTLSIAGQTKSVLDYGGAIVGLPDSIQNLAPAIQKAVNVERWTIGNAATAPSLLAEHLNFAIPTPDNVNIFTNAISRNDRDVVQLFLTSGAQIFTSDPKLTSPVCAASRTGNVGLVQQMLSTVDPHGVLRTPFLAECLSAAAASGNLEMVDLWLARGARLGFQPPQDVALYWPKFASPMSQAIASGNPAVLARLLDLHPDLHSGPDRSAPLLAGVLARGDSKHWDETRTMLSLLLAAGADVNASEKNIPPAIFQIQFTPSAIPILLSGGADINARNAIGDTPLINAAFVLPAVKALLAAGADPNLKDNLGKTALDHARQYGCKECATLLEAAMVPGPPKAP
jgi:ankyrin repeat protein